LRGIEDPAGACEVVFETEHHKHPIHSRSPEEMAFCIRAIVNRYQTARLDPQARFWYGFKNLGKAAGGTIDHEHWQLYTFSFVPPAIQERYERAAQYFNRTGRSLYGDRFAAEVASGERIVAASPHFLTFVPFAAGMPYQIRIVPKRHTADFSRMTGDQLIDFGVSLRDAVARLCGVIPDLAFNIELHTAAFEHASAPWFCWHLEIVPRITTLAGVELGLNVMVNPVLPEEAASKLRAVSVG
jgi:UDPglucose--hexose-1-phosphate uridylyltransferase